MDNEGVHEEMAKPSMPKGPAFFSSAPKGDDAERSEGVEPPRKSELALSPAPGEKGGVFRQLVTDDNDIAGLVAYSIYKQNKLEWLNAFTSSKGRPPTDDELAAYIIGEGTQRRLATYRHLAEATLSGEGVTSGSAASDAARNLFRRGPGFGERSALSVGLLATYALIAVLFLIGFLVAARYTMGMH